MVRLVSTAPFLAAPFLAARFLTVLVSRALPLVHLPAR